MDICYVQLISATTALVAVVVGPLITLHIARKQINSSVLAKNRQEWINTLRNELSEAIVVIRSVETIMKLPLEHRDENRLMELAENGKLKEAKIRLLINPEEPDHAALVNLLQETLVLAIKAKEQNPVNLEDYEDKIIKKSQAILKREWVRVKALE